MLSLCSVGWGGAGFGTGYGSGYSGGPMKNTGGYSQKAPGPYGGMPLPMQTLGFQK